MTAMRCTQAPSGLAAETASLLREGVPILGTARLQLRAATMADLPLWTALYMADFADDGDTEEDAWTEFSYYTAGWLLHGHGLWTVTHRSDGRAIGFVLLGLEWGDDEPELGYIFAPGARGQGFATEAAAAARDYGLRLLGPGQFVSYVDHANAKSRAVVERLGAVRDTDAEAAHPEDIAIWRHGAAARS